MLAASPVYPHQPMLRSLAADPRVHLTTIYASNVGLRPNDPGYGREFAWDVDLTAGDEVRFLRHADTNRTGGGLFSLRDVDVIGEIVRGGYEVLFIFGYNSITHLLAVTTQRARGGKVIAREEQTLLHPRPLLTTIAKEVGLRVLYRGAFGLYISSENRRWFEHYGIPPERLFFTPYSVDNERFATERAALLPRRDELRRQFGIGEDSGPVFLYVGRLIPKKQPLFLLEAFARARSRVACTLLVVGSGECEAEMRAQIERRQIPDIVFAGFLNQSQVTRAYACADAFTLLSKEHETFGLVVNEAMNFGLPLVLSDKVGSGADLLSDGLNGYRVLSTDVSAAAARLETLAADPELRTQMGAQSLARIQDWTGEVGAKGVISAVAAAVGRDRWAHADV
jgi:glycosyltransferase involved in cell wall biosynthesis